MSTLTAKPAVRCSAWLGVAGVGKWLFRLIPASLVRALSGPRDSEWRMLVMALVFAVASLLLGVFSVADLFWRIGAASRLRQLDAEVTRLELSASSDLLEKTPPPEQALQNQPIPKSEATTDALNGASAPAPMPRDGASPVLHP